MIVSRPIFQEPRIIMRPVLKWLDLAHNSGQKLHTTTQQPTHSSKIGTVVTQNHRCRKGLFW